jgi:hypothetical protein
MTATRSSLRLRKGRRRLVAPLAIALSLSLASSFAPRLAAAEGRWDAPASEPSKAALDEAHARYVAGNRAVEQGRWADALVDFEKAYALSGVPAALFNVATTLRALGRHREARDAFALLLSRHGPKLDPAVKKDAERMRAEAAARVGTLVLEELPSRTPELHVYVDGAPAADGGARPLSIEVDPGKHALRVEEPSAQTFTWEGTFADGERKSVRVQLASRANVSALPPAPKTESGSLWSSPYFWTAVGVVVVGGAVVGGYYWHKERQVEPQSGLVVKL